MNCNNSVSDRMPAIHDKLIPLFRRDVEKIKGLQRNINEGAKSDIISPENVLRAHYFIVDYFYETGEDKVFMAGIKDEKIFLSSLDRAYVEFDGIKKWKNIYERTATVFFGIIKNHPFHDANKRTAFLSAISMLYENKIVITDKYIKEFEDLAVNIASNRIMRYRSYKNKYRKMDDGEIYFISKWIKKRSRKIDKRYYAITYRQLDSKLSRFGFRLCSPRKNYIHVCDKNGNKLCEIGFPSWGVQVGKKAIRTILAATGLKADYGYDAASFFKGEDPYAYVINKYKKNFESLKYR